MAEEAFALSPISARAALPSEEDYAAISEAFMETSRGRWFLGEYAKRNRNADTSMVLDAVARIEQSLAAQRQAVAEADTELAEARVAEVVSAIRGAVDAAQVSATEALDSLALEQKLAPVRKGARVIREIAWRLREIGNDGRICDLIDSQVSVIEAGAAHISSDEAKAALSAAFATIAGQLAELSDDQTPVAEAPISEAPVSEAPLASFAAPPQHENPVADPAVAELAPAPDSHQAPTDAAASAAASAMAEAEVAETAEVYDETAADAHDEAVLDMIAMEMGAPDPFDSDDTAGMIGEEAHLAEEMPTEPEIVAQAPEPVTAEPPLETPPHALVEASPEPTKEAVKEASKETSMEISLGSTIIASGLVRRPNLAANDPLAPIRRMSQAEKIAFFS